MEQTIEKLLHQEFGQAMRGYNKDQVDDFLDEVIEDIEKLQKKHDLLLDEKKILEKNNFELKMKMLDMQEKMSTRDSLSNTTALGQTKLVTPVATPVQPTAPVESVEPAQPERRVQIAPAEPAIPEPAPILEDPVETKPQEFSPELGAAVTHEDSKADDHTLQDRIEQLEKELNNIKSFTE